MDKLGTIEIGLLYQKLVILPKDKVIDTAPIPSISAEKVTLLKESEAIETNIAKEAPAEYATKSHPRFAIITLPDHKINYLRNDSKFLKVIEALDANKLLDHIYTDWLTEIDLRGTQAVWVVGLSSDEEKVLRAKNHPNILFSPDIESLEDKEDKKAMFLPLKDFMARNKHLLK